MQRWMWWIGCVACLLGLAWFSLPVPEVVEVYQTRPPAWTVRVSRPAFLRAGEGSSFTLEMRPPQDLIPADQSVRARLELAGLVDAASQEVGEAILPVGSASFNWLVRADAPREYEGRLWVYAGVVPVLLNVRPVMLEVRGPALALLWALRVALAAGAFMAGWAAGRGRAPGLPKAGWLKRLLDKPT